jgi:hypothetical protein
MNPHLARFASLLQFLYGWMLIVVGVAGILAPRWELRSVFGLDSAVWPVRVQSTFLNQYRFLKSMELGAGLFCIAFRPAILTGGMPGRVFLAIVAAGVVARTTAWAADGTPDLAFLIFLALELLVFVVVALHLARGHAGDR